MKKLCLLLVLLLCFGLGAFVWKVLNTSYYFAAEVSSREQGPFRPRMQQAILVEIEGTPITRQDVEFEYDLLVQELRAAPADKVQAPPVKAEAELGPLQDNITNSLVERKLLYQLVRQDKSFNLADSSRYKNCLKQWQQTLLNNNSFFATQEHQERLKARLCEYDILGQYLEEKIYAPLHIDAQRLQELYESHRDELHSPAMVQIRQIVLADEDQARKVLGLVNTHNFAALAREYSITPEAEQGGLLPPFAKGGGMPRFFDVAFTLRPGQISAILKSTYGFHLIMLEKKIRERRLSYQEAVPHIHKHVLNMEKERAYQQWVDLALHTVKVSTPLKR